MQTIHVCVCSKMANRSQDFMYACQLQQLQSVQIFKLRKYKELEFRWIKFDIMVLCVRACKSITSWEQFDNGKNQIVLGTY